MGRSVLSWHPRWSALPLPLDFLRALTCTSPLKGMNAVKMLVNCLGVSLHFWWASTDPWSSVRKNCKCSFCVSTVKQKNPGTAGFNSVFLNNIDFCIHVILLMLLNQSGRGNYLIFKNTRQNHWIKEVQGLEGTTKHHWAPLLKQVLYNRSHR